MLSEELLKKGFRYRREKLWMDLGADQVFVVQFSDGQKGYCHIMGQTGMYNALSIYVGQDHFQRFYDTPGIGELDSDDLGLGETDMDTTTAMRLQDCLRLEVVSEEDMKDFTVGNPGALDREETYAKAHRIPLHVDLPYICPIHLRPQYADGPLMGKDEMYLLEALDACHAIKQAIQNRSFPWDRLLSLHTTKGGMTLVLYKEGRSWKMGDIRVPLRRAETYGEPAFGNEILTAQVKMALRKQHEEMVGEFKLVLADLSVLEGGRPMFPWMGILYHEEEDQLTAMPPTMTLDEKALNSLGQAMVKMQLVPQEILVDDERSFHFLRHFCEATGIRLEMVDYMPQVREAIEEMQERLSSENGPEDALRQMEETVRGMSDDQIRLIPKSLQDSLHQLYRLGQLSDMLGGRLAKVLDWRQ